MEKLIKYILFIDQGLVLKLKLLIDGLFVVVLLFIIPSILQYNKIANFIITRHISLLRGMPLILQLSLIYFTAPNIIGIKLDVLTAGITAFGVNSSAYIAI